MSPEMGEAWRRIGNFIRFIVIYGAIIVVAALYVWPRSERLAVGVLVVGFWAAMLLVAIWEELRPSDP
jgi:hypothetical protein